MIKLDNQKKIKNFGKPYFIAEIGANHNGDMDLAKQMINQAKEAGADCVKFQSWKKIKNPQKKKLIMLKFEIIKLTFFQKRSFC